MSILKMSLEQKIGQMFMCGFATKELNEHAQTLITDYHVGGIIYFRRNINDVKQVADLSIALQEIAANEGLPPLWISTDQEGGMVARIDVDGIDLIPGNMALGAAGNTEYTYKAAQLNASQLLSLGINMNLAPSLDVNNNAKNPIIGVRSFGEIAEKVSEHGVAVVNAYQDLGLSAVGKHFPGHGDTDVDSHHGLAVVAHDITRLKEVELLPFVKAIDSGIDAIMTAHVIFSAIEPNDIPATLSSAVLNDLLRVEMGFQGIIMTDCLEMHAISRNVGIAEGAVQAVLAGADCILVSHNLSSQIEAISAVKEAVESGRISESIIDDSVKRILEVKHRRAQQLGVISSEDEQTKSLLTKIACSSITLVKDEGQLPLKSDESLLVIWPEVSLENQMDERWNRLLTLGMALQGHVSELKELRICSEPSEAEIENAVSTAKGYSQIVMATYTAGGVLPIGQSVIVNRLLEQEHTRFIVTATRNPYDINEIENVPAYLCCYDNTSIMIESLASVLMGLQKAEGSLPVTINDLYRVGWKKE